MKLANTQCSERCELTLLGVQVPPSTPELVLLNGIIISELYYLKNVETSMIYKNKPEGFRAKFEVVSCFMELNGKILLLLRQDHKPQGNTWGVPAGKMDDGEDSLSAIYRELEEETGHKPVKDSITFHSKLFVRYPEFDFIYHIFHLKVQNELTITINEEEHKEYLWVSPTDAMSMNLIGGEDECIKLFYRL